MAKLEPHPLMRTIVDHPDEDLPRLVYADWLDEQGDPHWSLLAEYIRLSIEAESAAPRSDARTAVERRLLELEATTPSALCPPMPEWATHQVRLRRGLPVELWCTPRQFAERGEVLEFAPITRLNLFNANHFVDNLSFVPAALGRQELARVRRLRIVTDLSDEAVTALVSNPAVATIRVLEVESVARVAPRLAEILAAGAARFARMTNLKVRVGILPLSDRETLESAYGDRVKFVNYMGTDATP